MYTREITTSIIKEAFYLASVLDDRSEAFAVLFELKDKYDLIPACDNISMSDSEYVLSACVYDYNDRNKDLCKDAIDDLDEFFTKLLAGEYS